MERLEEICDKLILFKALHILGVSNKHNVSEKHTSKTRAHYELAEPDIFEIP